MYRVDAVLAEGSLLSSLSSSPQKYRLVAASCLSAGLAPLSEISYDQAPVFADDPSPMLPKDEGPRLLILIR